MVDNNNITKYLEEKSSLFLNVFENMVDAYLIMDINGNVVRMNQSAKEMFGYDCDKEDFNVMRLIYEGDYEYAMKSFTKLRLEGKFKDYEARIHTKSRELKWIHLNASIVYDNSGNPIAAQGIIRDITKIKRNVEIIENQKKELDIIIDNSSTGIFLTRFGSIIRANKAGQNMFGYTEKEIVSKSIKDITYSFDFKESKEFLDKMNKGELDNFKFVKRYKKKKGDFFWGETNVSVVRDKNGDIDYQVSMVRNITYQRENKLMVDITNNIAKSILGKLDLHEIVKEITSTIATYLGTEDCIIYLINKEKENLEQVAAHGSKKNDLGEIINKLTLKIGEGIVGDVARKGKPEIVSDTSKDKRYITDDSDRYSEITVPIIYDGEVVGIIDSEHSKKNYFTQEQLDTLVRVSNLVSMQFRNAIQLKEIGNARNQLLESENRLASVIRNLDHGVLLENEKREIKIANKKLYELFKIQDDPEDYIGSDLKSRVEIEAKYFFNDSENFLNDLNAIIEKKEVVLGQELVLKDGRVFERDYTPIFEKEVCTGHLWSFKDITYKKRYRENLEVEKQRYSSIIANMNLGFIEIDKSFKIVTANHRISEMTGYSEKELLGRKLSEGTVVQESLPLIAQEVKKRFNKKESSSYEITAKTKSGDKQYWLISGSPNYNTDGSVKGTIAVVLDITDLKNLQIQKEDLLQQLKRSNNELNEYAHIVSHDLKSPLRSVSALISWIKDDYKSMFDEEGINNFNHIEEKIERMDSLIDGILNYSSITTKNQTSEMVDLNMVIDDITKIIHIPDHVEISIKKKLPTIAANSTKMQQLFQNLISNSIHYIDKEKGLIEINYKESKKFFEFSIKDNGIGIAKEYHEKIFKIFQSVNNNDDYESTGIGLSIVKKIVTLYKGEIWLESEVNKGSTFYFKLKK